MGAEPARALAQHRSNAQAWSAFWEEQGADSRCLADAHPETRQGLAAHWAGFAATLAPRARVLDLGCGGGVVGRTLLAARPDLRITGIDLAHIPPAADPRLTLLGATRMERLPFGDRQFDAAVSQFGFEYGDVGEAAGETARVLVPGAPVSFIVHHAGSAIAGQSRARRRALNALIGEGVRRAFLAGRAVALDRQLWAIRQSAPAEPLVVQAAQALRPRVGCGGAARGAIWQALTEALAPERALLAALEKSCVAPEALTLWLGRLAGRFKIGTATALHRPNGEAIAWRIAGVRLGIRD